MRRTQLRRRYRTTLSEGSDGRPLPPPLQLRWPTYLEIVGDRCTCQGRQIFTTNIAQDFEMFRRAWYVRRAPFFEFPSKRENKREYIFSWVRRI